MNVNVIELLLIRNKVALSLYMLHIIRNHDRMGKTELFTESKNKMCVEI